MDDVYRHLLSELIKKKRMEKGFSIAKTSMIFDISPSTISRIENSNNSVNDDTYSYLAKKFNIHVNFEYYECLFTNFYNMVVYGYKYDVVSILWNEIEKNKEELLDSPYIYKYHLYHLVYLLNINQNSNDISYVDVLYLLNNKKYLVDFDKAVLYDNVSLYYFFLQNYEKMNINSLKALEYDKYEIPYAMALFHSVENDTYNEKFICAIDKLRTSITIFKKYGYNNRVIGCYFDMGNVYSNMGQIDEALKIFNDTYNCSIYKLKISSLNNILLCYVLIDDFNRVINLLDNIDNKLLLDVKPSFYEIVLRYFLAKEDYMRFDVWYKKFKSINKKNKLYNMIIEFYNSYRNKLPDENLGDKCLAFIKLPYNKREYIFISKLLINIYYKKGNIDKAVELSKSISKIITNKSLTFLTSF